MSVGSFLSGVRKRVGAYLLGNVERAAPLNDPNLLQAIFGSSVFLPGSPTVTESSALRLTAVYNCLNVLGETIGALPCDVKRQTSRGAEKQYNHPVYRLVHTRPNPYTTAFDFWKAMEILCRAWGNSYAMIMRNGANDPISLWLLMPWQTQIIKRGDGTFFYMNNGATLYPTDVIHFKNFSLDGICGISTIKQNAMTVAHGIKLQQYNTTIINSRPPGYLTAASKPKDANQKENIKRMWTRPDEGTTEPITGIPLLYGGIEFKALPLPAEDVAYIDSVKANKTDICGMFRVPPTLIQDYTSVTWNNAEQQNIVYVRYTVIPMITPKEQELTEKLFPEANKLSHEPLEVRFNVRGLLQGDLKAQQEFFHALITDAVLTPNQVLELLDMPTYEGGDEHYIQGAMVPVSMLKEVLTKKQKPVSDTQKEKLKSILNGHYKDVAEILDL